MPTKKYPHFFPRNLFGIDIRSMTEINFGNKVAAYTSVDTKYILGENDTVKNRLLNILLIKIKILERISDTSCLREAMLTPQYLCLYPAIKIIQKYKPKISQHSISHENM